MSTEYYKTPESVSEYIKMAEGHNGSTLISQLQKYLPSQASVLEIGSGPGTDWQILNEKYEVTGSDFSNEFLVRLRAAHPKNEFLQLDASTLDTDQKFDAIYSNKVLHHLTDKSLKASIKRQHEILNQGGIICHSFWKGEGTEIFKGMFVNYHTDKDLKALFRDDFEILLLDSYAEFEKGDSSLMIARKK